MNERHEKKPKRGQGYHKREIHHPAYRGSGHTGIKQNGKRPFPVCRGSNRKQLFGSDQDRRWASS